MKLNIFSCGLQKSDLHENVKFSSIPFAILQQAINI